MEKNDALEITNFLINNQLSFKYIDYVKFWLELSEIKIT
jgi:hypothetical protein